MTRVITVTSGKGGVGKTNISANLAIHLAQLGYRTCLLDADLGLANINILLKIYPEYNLKDVILYNKDIQDIIIEPYPGMEIIPGSSGVEEMANLNPDQVIKLITEFSKLGTYDYFIIDTAAGISRDVISFCLASSELILIITPDPTSLTDAYSLMKILTLNGFNDPVMAIINQSPGLQSAKNALGKIAATCTRYLSLKIIPIGVMGRDQNVVSAVTKQKPFITLYPNTSASKSIKKIAENLIRKESREELTLDLETFWEKCLTFFTKKLRTGIKKNEKPSSSDSIIPEPSESKGVHAPSKSQASPPAPSSTSLSTDPSASLPPDILTSPTADPSASFRADSSKEDSSTLPPMPPDSPDNKREYRDDQDTTLQKVKDLQDKSIQAAPSEEASAAPPTPPLQPPGVPDTTQMILQTNQLLNQVVESIASVASELKEIRELFATSKTEESHGKENAMTEDKKREAKEKNEKDDNQLALLLSNYAMFQSLEDHEIKSIVKHLKLRNADPGKVLIQKGDPGENLYIMISGKVDVMDDQGNVLDTMERQDVFGEMSLISGDPVNATIKVVEKAQLLYLNGREFIRLLRTYPGLQMYFARLLSKRLSRRLEKADKAKAEYLQSGLSGSLAETSIPELLQMLNLGQKTGLLTFHLPKGEATLSFHNGNLVASMYEEEEGIGAFYKILEESRGRFIYSSELPVEDQEKPPMGHFMKLLMEGLSRIDEQNG